MPPILIAMGELLFHTRLRACSTPAKGLAAGQFLIRLQDGFDKASIFCFLGFEIPVGRRFLQNLVKRHV